MLFTIKKGASGGGAYGNIMDGADAQAEIERFCDWLMRGAGQMDTPDAVRCCIVPRVVVCAETGAAVCDVVC